MGPFRRYIVQRLVASGLTLLGVSCIIFLMVRLLPGDPARVIAGLLASEEDVVMIRRQLGLDQPLHIQYVAFSCALCAVTWGCRRVPQSQSCAKSRVASQPPCSWR